MKYLIITLSILLSSCQSIEEVQEEALASMRGEWTDMYTGASITIHSGFLTSDQTDVEYQLKVSNDRVVDLKPYGAVDDPSTLEDEATTWTYFYHIEANGDVLRLEARDEECPNQNYYLVR